MNTTTATVSFSFPMEPRTVAALITRRHQKTVERREELERTVARLGTKTGTFHGLLEGMKTDRFAKRRQEDDERLLVLLSSHPVDRLWETLDFWIDNQREVAFTEEDWEEDWSMLPWLEAAMWALLHGEWAQAFQHLHEMKEQLGGLVPACLNLSDDRWGDVFFVAA